MHKIKFPRKGRGPRTATTRPAPISNAGGPMGQATRDDLCRGMNCSNNYPCAALTHLGRRSVDVLTAQAFSGLPETEMRLMQ
jgi:hypothetical protein